MKTENLQIEHFRVAELAARTVAGLIERRTMENPAPEEVASRIAAAWLKAYAVVSASGTATGPEAAQSVEKA